MDIDQESSSASGHAVVGGKVPCCSPFESVDLIREIATFLVDDPNVVAKLSVVSKACHVAILDSPQVWRCICQTRWKQKWGYVQRWRSSETQSVPSGTWWRDRYHWQEGDGRRARITAAELHTLYFDFRFWLSQFWGHGNLLESGLRWTASQNLRFSRRQHAYQSNPEFSWPGMERGVLDGHPTGREDLEWFLDQDGQQVQWGKLPTLWPKGTIHRLPTWGWEIRNPNVCLRAMDSTEITLATGETTLEMVKDDENLWSDYLASLRRYPTDFGMPQEGLAFIEAPESFWSFPANRQRFPRLGVDEIVPVEEMED